MTSHDTPIIEREPCTRCAGSGNYSYCQDYGTKCFKCRGTGQQVTKRGKTVANWIAEQRRTDALSVKVGDRVSYDEVYPAGTIRRRFTIAEIVEDEPIKGSSLKDGVMVPFTLRSVTLISTEGKRYSFGGPVPLMMDITDELRRAAAEYRDTLTLAGAPRKQRAA